MVNKINDLKKHPLVQISAIEEYEKGNATTYKDYPSLELVRLENIFFKNNVGKVLEYGFGSGCNTEHLLKKNYHVTGIDISKNACTVTKKRIKRFKGKFKLYHLKKEAKKLPFKNNSFDYIVALSVLSLLGSERKIKNLLVEFERVLKPGGKIILDINTNRSEFGQKKINKNLFKTKILENEIFTYCPSNIKSFENLVAKLFWIEDRGISYFKVFDRKIEEYNISATSKK